MQLHKKLLSIVVPVFNEEANVVPFHDAVSSVMASLSDRYLYEFVFTDNHSTDNTFAILQTMANRDQRIRVVRFSRNFGYQRSIYTAYMHARGDAAIQLDCDLQDPPELIPEFIKKWEEGYQVVYGVRIARQESWAINLSRKIFYRLIDSLSEDYLPHDAGDFRLVDRLVIDELKKIEDQQPYLRGSISCMGFNQIGLTYGRNPRFRGESKFSMADLVGLAVDGILNHSIVPLRISTYLGMGISLLTFLGIAAYVVGKVLYGGNWPRGFATLTVLMLLSISLNAVFLGIIGEYLGRMYQQVKKHPLVIVEQSINIVK